MSDTPVKDNNAVITTKIYPTKYKNRKGFRVGNMKISFDTKNAPFTSSDQVDHYLNELFSYIKWTSTKKHPDDETIEDKQKSIHDFLKAKKIEHIFSPKVVLDTKGGKGKKQTKKRKMKKGKSKTNKRKMKIHKGGNQLNSETKSYIDIAIENGLIDQLESVLKKHPSYANYALDKIPNITELDEQERKEMEEIIISIIKRNQNKDN